MVKRLVDDGVQKIEMKIRSIKSWQITEVNKNNVLCVHSKSTPTNGNQRK